MVRVIWSKAAIDDVEAVRLYIAQFDGLAADSTAGQLLRAGESLVDFPNRGRPAHDDCRELVTLRNYKIRYRVAGESVFIRSVRHMARRSDL